MKHIQPLEDHFKILFKKKQNKVPNQGNESQFQTISLILNPNTKNTGITENTPPTKDAEKTIPICFTIKHGIKIRSIFQQKPFTKFLTSKTLHINLKVMQVQKIFSVQLVAIFHFKILQT